MHVTRTHPVRRLARGLNATDVVQVREISVLLFRRCCCCDTRWHVKAGAPPLTAADGPPDDDRLARIHQKTETKKPYPRNARSYTVFQKLKKENISSGSTTK